MGAVPCHGIERTAVYAVTRNEAGTHNVARLTAVVCDSGAVLSHAAIVAREMGIPAVLIVPNI